MMTRRDVTPQWTDLTGAVATVFGLILLASFAGLVLLGLRLLLQAFGL